MWRYDGVWKDKDDNEPHVGGGSHVYCIAKNGKQAGIVWGHAKNMVENSPEPGWECDLGDIRTNNMKSLLFYKPKLSNLTTITGDSRAALAAAEGINAACIICDEAHVVDESTVEVTTDAGASQDQFLWFQISTYGNTEGYGKKDLDLGRKVANGEVEDDAFFFKTYEAPQDATDIECGTEEIWRQANPNLGYTVSASQFRQSYERAKDDPPKWAGFKQRRLNIWQRAANPMFNWDQWCACGCDDIPDQPKNVGGGAGLDIAATDDWTAFALAWDEENETKIWVRMWTSEGWIEENGHRAQFGQWMADEWLQVHDGGAVDHEVIQDEVLAILKKSRTRELGYDAKFGLQMSQALRKRLPRCEIHPFSQAVSAYAVGSAEIMNGVKNSTIRHQGNPALNWQAGHVKAKQMGPYTKPVKDDDMPWQKIDAIQAICMALDCKTHAQSVKVKPFVGQF